MIVLRCIFILIFLYRQNYYRKIQHLSSTCFLFLFCLEITNDQLAPGLQNYDNISRTIFMYFFFFFRLVETLNRETSVSSKGLDCMYDLRGYQADRASDFSFLRLD